MSEREFAALFILALLLVEFTRIRLKNMQIFRDSNASLDFDYSSSTISCCQCASLEILYVWATRHTAHRRTHTLTIPRDALSGRDVQRRLLYRGVKITATLICSFAPPQNLKLIFVIRCVKEQVLSRFLYFAVCVCVQKSINLKSSDTQTLL